MKKTLVLVLGCISLNSYGNAFINGNFNSEIFKYSPSPDSWKIQDNESGYDPKNNSYGGLITRKKEGSNYYIEVNSHAPNLDAKDCKSFPNNANNCHRAEFWESFDDSSYLAFEGQRTEFVYKFRLEQIWDEDCLSQNGGLCYSTIMQFTGVGAPTEEAVAPMMSFVLARYAPSKQPQITLQHKIQCSKFSNKEHYPKICDNKEGKVGWQADTYIPIDLNTWYEAYIHVYWSENNGEFSAAIRPVGGNWTHFAKDGKLFHKAPTRSANVEHAVKFGNYGYGYDVSETQNPLIISFDDFTSWR